MISILYVDDEPGLLELCRIFLEQTGEFRVDTVESGADALAQLNRTPYDAVVSDYQMPEMDGISLLKAIRRQDEDMPFILFTGRGREEVVIESINNGADFYIQKGGDPKAQFVELMHKVRQAVDKRQAEKNLHESEKRLTDIINFLPDPTFAIDREGRVIAETDLPRPRGEPLTLMGKASPLYDRKGEIAGAIESIRDITARKQEEDELRAAYEEIKATEEELRGQYDITSKNEQVIRDSEEKYRTLVENSLDVIYIYRGDHFLLMNKRGSEVTGFTYEELMQMKVWDFLHPDDLKRVFAAGKARIQGADIPTRYTARILTKSGGAIPMDMIAVLITYQGEPAIMGIARDVTEREEYISGIARKTKVLTIINRIIQIAGRKREMSELLDTALSSILELLGYDAGGIYLLEEGGETARIVCSKNLPPEFFQAIDCVRIHDPPFSTVFVSGKPLIGTQFHTTNPEYAKKFGIQSFVSVPITTDEKVIGALNVATSRQNDISADEQEVLAAIGKELGSAITRMKAEAALQESEAQYRTLIETTGTGFVIIDEQGRVVDANPEYVRMTGRAGLSEIRGRPVTEWTVPGELEKNIQAIRECLEKGYIRNFEIEYLDPSGSITPVEVNATAVTSKGAVRIVTLCRDISSRRRAEQALRQSEELYGTLADAAQDLIYIISKDDRVAYVNTFAAGMIGRSRQEIIGRPRADLFPGAEGEHQYRNLQTVFSSGIPLRVESRVPMPSGDTWQNTHLIPLKDPSGAVSAILGISRDITTLKQAEEALRSSESKYRSIIDNVQDMIYRTDMDGKITMISPAGAKHAGFGSPEEMVGLDLAQTLYADPQERKRFLAILEKNGSVNGYPLTLKDRTGYRYPVTASSHYYRDENGKVLGVEGIVHDVTHLKQAEDVLKEANRKLNLLNSITRHDVANQLTVLQGYIQLAMIKNPDPVIGDFLQKIDAVTTTIGKQIDFSKTYQELGEQDPGWYRLDDIFARTRPRDILFSSSCTGAEIFADPMLEKVFANLFGNAIMHGERVSRITVRCDPAGDDLLVTVEDNGVGIPLDLKQKIFKKGFGKNTGFGLFLAREILGITGILIHETGTHGKGARFEIIVPKGGFRFSDKVINPAE